jgi:hypothetical protein
MKKEKVEGIKKHNHLLRQAGKGCLKRKVDLKKYEANFEQINWKSKKKIV